MFYITLNGKTNEEIGLDIMKRPDIPAPVEIVNKYFISGRGYLYEHTGCYEDITFTIPFNYITDNEIAFNNVWRNFKNWLLNLYDNRMVFSDDILFYYEVKNIKINPNARNELFNLGSTEVEFTIGPYQYLINGENAIPITNTTNIYNEYQESHPVYQITGEGLLTLKVNGIEVTAQIGQNLTIDTELKICYRADKTFNNIALNGEYSSLYLKHGINTLSFSGAGTYTVKVIPRWRCL